MLNKIKISIAAFSLAILLLAINVSAQQVSSARGLALGTASTSLAIGVDAARYNPANLGLSTHQQNGLEVIGVGVDISNNAFSISEFNDYMGAFITDDGRQDILNKIPDDGLRLNALSNASALGFSYGSSAFAMSGTGIADIDVNRDVMELALNGITLADSINLEGSYSEAYAYFSAGVSFGRSIIAIGESELAVGATFKYLRGIGIERILKLEGNVSTLATSLGGEATLLAQSADGGSGYAVDVGAAYKINNSYTLGLSVENFASKLTWNTNPQEHSFHIQVDTSLVATTGNFYQSSDLTVPIESFETELSSQLNLGLAKTSGKLLWAVNWKQGFTDDIGVSKNPIIGVGAEFNGFKYTPLRAGIVTGGDAGTAISFGSGVRLPLFYVDVAFVTGKDYDVESSKGGTLALTTGFSF